MLKLLFVCAFGLVNFTASANAAPLRILNFNTMCDKCKGAPIYGKFEERWPRIVDTIQRYHPDLLSLQEIRTESQVKRLNRAFPGVYTWVYFKSGLIKYTDVVLGFRTARFEMLGHTGGWLGPRWPKFSLGWEIGLPRRLNTVTLRDRQDGLTFFLSGTHFDNNSANKEPSARILANRTALQEIPGIFAGDSNLPPHTTGYAQMRQQFRDSFLEVAAELSANGPFESREACHYPDRDQYPGCRIDHVLLTHNAPWKAERFVIDLYRYGPKKQLASDHRAVIVDLK
jgi:exonuclease III